MRKVILLVDDDDLQRRVSIVDLEASGFDVIEAASGDEALAAAGRLRPDLVLLDVMMPGANGFECLAELKSDPRYSDIPVVMMTAADAMEDELQGIAGGADRYLTKPVHPDLLVRTVRKVLAEKASTGD